MKAGLASMLMAMAVAGRGGWRPKGNVRLAVTVGEEVDCVGARHLRDTGGLDGVGWIVIGEPTNLDVGGGPSWRDLAPDRPGTARRPTARCRTWASTPS